MYPHQNIHTLKRKPIQNYKGFKWSCACIHILKVYVFLVVLLGSFHSSFAQGNDDNVAAIIQMDSSSRVKSALKINGEVRMRGEWLNADFRRNRSGESGLLSIRSLLKGEFITDHIDYTLELADSRQYLAKEETTLNTSIVNSFDILQAHVKLKFGNTKHKTGNVKLGKFTMDVGSRRLVARNRFRNTINSFLGIDGSFALKNKAEVRGFIVFPVHRFPNEHELLTNNMSALDKVAWNTIFMGLTVEKWTSENGIKGEFFVFGFIENDVSWKPVRDRRLVTIGPRLTTPKGANKIDYEIETYFQLGKSSSSLSQESLKDLTHFARFHHLGIGYTMDRRWKPRLLLVFDYASGDKDPSDQKNNRFDTLFGARRFDFGPTSIYGAFARSNIISPGYKISINPLSNGSVEFYHRYFALASKYDTWTTSKLEDPTGNSGSSLGHQVDIRLRYHTLSKTLKFEGGIARLFSGDFILEAPESNANQHHTFLYAQMSYHF